MWISNAGMERDRISALKRSFEVENVDSSSQSSSPHMRRSPSIQRSSISPSISRHHELGANGAIKPKPQTPEAASRRAELSIGINAKAIDSSPSAGISRFNLRKPEVSGHNKMPEAQKPSGMFSKTLETTAPVVRTPSNASARQLPETPFRRNEPPESSVSKPEVKGQENHQHSSAITISSSPSHAERKSPINDAHRSEISTGFHGNMADKGADKGAELGYVGIDAILEQMKRNAMKQGFELNIMVVGQSGLGKSTLINTLFKSKVSRRSVMPSDEERIPQTIEIKSISHDIEEKGVKMKLTVIDTPGFGDQINNENCWMPIMKFINEQYETFLQEELNITRKKKIPDTHIEEKGVKMKLTVIDTPGFGDQINNENCWMPIMKFINEQYETFLQEELNITRKKKIPDTRVHCCIYFIPPTGHCDQEYQVNGKRLLGRKTRWGTVEVENVAHCEFAYLRDLLIRTHMQNLKDITSSIHYEVYRVRRLTESNTHTTHSNGEANGVLTHEM
ncbi:hypothetical protein PDJAM_G00114510 [Pangasius djambal]|uniref:Uncharacterized protein n=1 Tax=Pangasius djambal TaxID=1691987 RepID=A0ACC5Y2Z1_9TELE|nr:hypothetical protein [Pangasius djambal]